MAAAGLLIILNFLGFGALFLLFYRIREMSRAQGVLADRIAVIEEMMLELTHDDEILMETVPRDVEEAEFEAAVSADELPDLSDFSNPPVEEERTRKILELARRGVPAEAIAQQEGYSIGEVRLILNLHRRRTN